MVRHEVEQARYGQVFATPVLEHVWSDGPELNGALRDSILAHAARSPGEARSNLGGWHSETGALEFCGEAGRRLIAHM